MKKLILVCITAGAILSGCDNSCKKTVEDYATIQNMTGQSLVVSVCKGNYGESTLRLLPTTAGVVSLGSRTESKGQSGVGVCSSKTEKNRSLQLSLAPMSFGYVSLCYRQFDNTYIVSTPYQGCPYGYLEQTGTGPCPTTSR